MIWREKIKRDTYVKFVIIITKEREKRQIQPWKITKIVMQIYERRSESKIRPFFSHGNFIAPPLKKYNMAS